MENFKKRLIISLSVLGGSVLLFVILLILINSDINKSVAGIEEIKNQISQRNQIIELISSSASELEQVRADTEVLEEILPNQDDLINFPIELTRLANELNLDFSFQFGPETEKTELPAATTFTLTLTGLYDNIRQYLSELQKHQYIISFEKMDLRQDSSGGYTLTLDGSIFTSSGENQ